jgi:hypothetical protein
MIAQFALADCDGIYLEGDTLSWAIKSTEFAKAAQKYFTKIETDSSSMFSISYSAFKSDKQGNINAYHFFFNKETKELRWYTFSQHQRIKSLKKLNEEIYTQNRDVLSYFQVRAIDSPTKTQNDSSLTYTFVLRCVRTEKPLFVSVEQTAELDKMKHGTFVTRNITISTVNFD